MPRAWGMGLPLQPFQREALDGQLGKAGVHPRPAPAAKASANAHTGLPGKGKGPSKTEERFMAHLDLLKAAGLVVGWAYELCRVDLGVPGSRKKPDFWVQVAADHVGVWPTINGSSVGIVVVEVKPKDGTKGRAYMANKSPVPMKVAAAQLARVGVPMFLAWPAGDGWTFARVVTR